MLRFISGLNQAPTYLRAMAAAFVLASFVLPSAALAASTSFDLVDPLGSGYGVTISLDDSIEQGTISISLESSGAALPTGELGGINFQYDDELLFSGMQALGTDIAEIYARNSSPKDTPTNCPCNIKVDFGTVGFFELTGITETDFALVNDQRPITLADFAGSTVTAYLAIPEFATKGTSNSNGVASMSLLKIEGEIPVIPEPTTGALMLLGLLGLTFVSQKHA